MRATAIALGLSLLAGQVARALPAAAQTAEELNAARKLFAEAMADQDAKRYDTALDKFRRVAGVKDTASVRYRIASCLEALGRRAEALQSYQAAVRLGQQEKGAGDVLQAATQQAAALERVVPRLSIVLPADAPSNTEVRVDDAPVDRASLADGLLLDVGSHTIRATAPGDAPFETAVTLPEGGHVSITVKLAAPGAPPSAQGQQATQPPAGDQTAAPPHGADTVPVETPSRPSHTGAWIAIGIGGALAVGSVVSFVLRQSNMGTVNNDCPTSNGQALVCSDPSKKAEVTSALDAARWQGPLALGLAAGAVVSAGIGVWLLASTPSGSSVSLAPAFAPDGGLLVLRGRM